MTAARVAGTGRASLSLILLLLARLVRLGSLGMSRAFAPARRRAFAGVCARVLLTTILVGMGTTGCKGKVEQCNAFIERANQSQAELERLPLVVDDSAKIQADAAKIEAEARAIGAIPLKDDKLAKLRDEYAGTLVKLARSVREIGRPLGETKPPSLQAQAKQLQADVQKIEQEQIRLVGEINLYCSGAR